MAITNTGTTQVLNQSISGQVLEIAKAGTSVAARANVFQAKGQSKLLVDLGNTAATVVAEMASVVAADPTNFKEVTLRQKRMATAVEVSNDVVENSAVTLANHVTGILSDRIVRGIEAQMFNTGDAAGLTGLQNIVTYNSLAAGAKIEDIVVKTAASATAVTFQELVDTYVNLAKQPENLDGAIWVVEDITKFSAVKDSANNNVLTFDNLPAGAVGRLLGVPVYKTPAFLAGQKVAAILINPSKAYAVSISENATTKQIKGDTISEMKQMATFLGEVFIDGKVINPRAISMLKFL